MILLVAAAFALYGIYRIPRLIKERHWNDLVVFCFFFAAGLLLCAMLALGAAVPSLSEAVEGFLDFLNLHY